jgi:uncharacterized protein YjiS (DUF1127 family)
MLNKGVFCICIEIPLPRKIAPYPVEESIMEFNENRAAKPFADSPFHLIYKLPYRLWKAWRSRVETRKILSRLSESQLKDIGMTCEDVRRYK